MTDQTVGVLDQTGAGTKSVDVSEVVVGGKTVERQRIVLADPLNAARFVNVSAAGALQVDGSAVTQPISAAALPLPTGASQDGTDGTGIAAPTGGAGIRGWLSGIYNRLGGSLAVTGAFWQATQPVSIASMPSTPVTAAALPLPAGAAQDGTDGTSITLPAGGAGIRGWLSGIYNRLGGSLAVTGTFWQATQPVTGTFFQATQPASIADGSSLTVGAKADALQTDASQTASLMSVTKGMLSRLSAIATSIAGTLTISGNVGLVGNSTGAATQVAASVTNGTALAANAARKGAVYFNDPGATSGATMFLLLSATGATTTGNYSYQIAPRQTLDLVGEANFTGKVQVISSAALGTLMITEITA
jgi:hypothetical protein